MRLWSILILMILSMGFVQAELCGDGKEVNTNCTLVTPELSCGTYNYSIFNHTGGKVDNGSLGVFNAADSIYYINFSQGKGDYLVVLCDGTTREVSAYNGGIGMLGVLIILPLIMAFIFIYAGVHMGDDHAALKLGLFLLCPILFFVSLHFGMLTIVEYYDFQALEELIGGTAYWFGWLVFALFSYFIIYFIAKAIHIAAQKKKERLNY